jgi:hypothetical protein
LIELNVVLPESLSQMIFIGAAPGLRANRAMQSWQNSEISL